MLVKDLWEPQTAEACREHKCIVAMFPGGGGVLAAECMRSVKEAYWLDLGMPEALWILEVENFGPLIVTIDTKGNNMRDKRIKEIEKRKLLVLQG